MGQVGQIVDQGVGDCFCWWGLGGAEQYLGVGARPCRRISVVNGRSQIAEKDVQVIVAFIQ